MAILIKLTFSLVLTKILKSIHFGPIFGPNISSSSVITFFLFQNFRLSLSDFYFKNSIVKSDKKVGKFSKKKKVWNVPGGLGLSQIRLSFRNDFNPSCEGPFFSQALRRHEVFFVIQFEFGFPS